jgi:hypothetical protein
MFDHDDPFFFIRDSIAAQIPRGLFVSLLS